MSFPVVGIGASAGGLEAFSDLLKHLPLDTGMAFVLVQHLDPSHRSALTQILGSVTSLPVTEITDGLRVEPNRVYVIPPNASLLIEDGVLRLQPREEGRQPHHSINVFFESLARDRRAGAIGVILSGTASDGAAGMEAIKANEGLTFAQDDSAKYDSMPRNAIAAGCVDLVRSPAEIAHELARIARHPYVAPAASESLLSAQRRGAVGGRGGIQKILTLLRGDFGTDFTRYKSNTVQRRIARRMLLHKMDEANAYADLVRSDASERAALYSDLLINVTAFFRNTGAFEALKEKVFPRLIRQERVRPLRAWVVACSTGQEAYSVAMAYLECVEQAEANARKLQIFATDINDTLLVKARAGWYPDVLVHDLSPERLRRFFVKEAGGYRVAKFLRQMVVFARHDILTDPPFSRMDLITCRNLLIYLEAEPQRTILPALHYGLNPGGFLLLGETETISPVSELFDATDKKHKIFSKRSGPPPDYQRSVAWAKPAKDDARSGVSGREMAFAEVTARREADRIALGRYAPPGVLINAQWQVIESRGELGRFLKLPAGKASLDLLKMAHPGLMLPLRAALTKAKEKTQTVRTEGVKIDDTGRPLKVTLEVVPLVQSNERAYVIFFEVNTSVRPRSSLSGHPAAGKAARPATDARKGRARNHELRIAELERELQEARDYLQTVQEQNEGANEELQSSHEEVTSANEELQSINEELETSKEEMESANEELATVNEEMAARNAELNRVNADLYNLHASVKMAVLVLTRAMTIRSFTPHAEKIFNLLATDIGRPLRSVRHNLDFPDLQTLLQEVIDTISEREREVRDCEGHWFSLRARPYLTLDNKIDGAVLVLVDIDALKRTEGELKVIIGELETFSYTMAHDLRGPLRTISGYARALSVDHRAPHDEEGKELLTRIGDAANRMHRLISDVLSFTRLTRDALPLEAVRLSEIVSTIVEQYPGLKEAEIRTDGELPAVLANRAALTQAISNILSNAVKFAHRERVPEIQIRAEKESNWVTLFVQDNGIGIVPADQERIFQMFERGRDTESFEGTGIGLAIVRRTLERMGGSVGVYSEPDKGSTFWLKLRAPAKTQDQ